jgi:hypothetical protein
MIRFDILEARLPALRASFMNARPYSFVAIDDFCETRLVESLEEDMPDPKKGGINKSRDYVFAKSKFEKSRFRDLGSPFFDLYNDFISPRFQTILRRLTNEDVFVDPDFHGGGLHQGGAGSFLDMHVDFDYHPLHDRWFRNLNILLYLNKGWRPEYGGELKLRHRDASESIEIAPLFNRCVVMHTRDYTLHGYDSINFPEGTYRRSVAAYAYTLVAEPAKAPRSTVWYPENSGATKRLIGRHWGTLVGFKTKIFGSGTARNR